MNGQQLHNFVNDRMPGGGYPWELLGPSAQKAWDDAATDLPGTNANMALTDDQIEVIFNSMPGGPRGFCKEWGYVQFARCIMAAHNAELVNRAARAEQELEAMRRRWDMLVQIVQ